MKATHLQTEYLFAPLGLGTAEPRFFWHCEGGVRQTAYQITARRGEEIVWDSGKVESADMTHIRYAGKPLHSRDSIQWQVRLWDENDQPGEPSESRFELGLLQPSDWSAHWISGDYTPKKNTRYPVDCFQKAFSLSEPVRCARLYATACGLYEAHLNGQRVGDFQLAPGSTDFRKRIQYQTYDVTALLQKENTLEVQLADGWYRGSVGCFGFTNVFGRQTKLLCQLEITLQSGRVLNIVSDDSWRWSNDGPICFADLKDGEVYDAARKPSYSGKVRIVKERVCPTAADNVFPKTQEQFPAKKICTPAGKTVLDFGQNLAGFLAFRVKGARGQKLHILLGETLDKNREFTQENFQSQRPVKEPGQLASVLLITGNAARIPGAKQLTPKQEIVFTCSGGEDRYQTKFAVFGFRYALVEADFPIDEKYFTAVAVYSDMEQTGQFTCSEPKINRLVENTIWSMKGNFLDVPTDCPTRERLGWTGDAQVFFETGSYLMNTAPFFRKWMRDLQDAQLKDGKLPAVAPYSGASMLYDNTGSSVGWNDCGVLLPVRYWKRYGDTAALEENYPLLRRVAMYMIKNTGHKDKKMAKADPDNRFVYEKGVQLGEWLEPKDFKDEIKAGQQALQTETATAYLHYTMTCAAETAKALGKTEDAALFNEYADGAKKVYNRMFLPNGAPDTDVRQSWYVRWHWALPMMLFAPFLKSGWLKPWIIGNTASAQVFFPPPSYWAF